MTAGITRYLLGTVCFIVAMPCFLIGAFAAVISPAAGGRIPPAMAWAFLSVGVVLVVIGIYAWYRAVNVLPGEDLFSEQRGLMVSLIVITTLIIAGGTVYFAVNPDFWQGALRGLLVGG